MARQLLSKSDVDRKAWSNFISNHPFGNIFQTPEMYDIYDSTKNYSPVLVTIVDGKAKILGMLVSVIQKEFRGPLGDLTSRCITWGGPLIRDNVSGAERKDIFDELLKEQNRIVKKKAIYMQFRNLWDTAADKAIFIDNGYEYEEHLNIHIDLTRSRDELRSDIKRDKRRGIKKAEESGMTVMKIRNRSDIPHFYEMLKETYKDAKVPLSDISFFELVYDKLVEAGLADFYLSEMDKNFTAGRLVLQYKDTIYDWYAGDINEYVKYYPNEFLIWNIFINGKNDGYKKFDFMGAGKPDEKYGVRDWKLRFGGEVVEFGRYQNVFKKTKMKMAKLGMGILKKVQ